MLYRKIIAVCSQFHIKHLITLCGLNLEFLDRNFLIIIVIISHSALQFQLKQIAVPYSVLTVRGSANPFQLFPHEFHCRSLDRNLRILKTRI